MRPAVAILSCCCALLLTTARLASAEWQFTPLVGVTFAGNTSIVDLENASGKVHRQFGGAVDVVGGGLFGVEAIAIYTPGFFQSGDQRLVSSSRTLTVMANGVVTLPRRWTEYNLRPILSGGFGLVRASLLDSAGAFPVQSNLGGFNIGGGAVGFVSQRTGLRFDLRYFSSLHRIEQGPIAFGRAHLSYVTGSVGIVLRR